MRLRVTVDTIDRFKKHYATLADGLCRPGSDFQKKLLAFTSGERKPEFADGYLALVRFDGDIVGWARSEQWEENPLHHWDTLEAFVQPDSRRRGLATLASLALCSGPLYGSDRIAVFNVAMLMVARQAGVAAQLFTRRQTDRWVRA